MQMMWCLWIKSQDVQSQLNFLHNWCGQYKSKILYARNYQKPRNPTNLFCGDKELKNSTSYRYLGHHIHERLSHETYVQILTNSAKRAFWAIIGMFKQLKNIGYKTCDTLYKSNILSFMNYASRVWRFKTSE